MHSLRCVLLREQLLQQLYLQSREQAEIRSVAQVNK
jgi:hypothetical protein